MAVETGEAKGACAPGGTVQGAAFGGKFGNSAASGELAFAKIQYSLVQYNAISSSDVVLDLSLIHI